MLQIACRSYKPAHSSRQRHRIHRAQPGSEIDLGLPFQRESCSKRRFHTSFSAVVYVVEVCWGTEESRCPKGGGWRSSLDSTIAGATTCTTAPKHDFLALGHRLALAQSVHSSATSVLIPAVLAGLFGFGTHSSSSPRMFHLAAGTQRSLLVDEFSMDSCYCDIGV